MNRADEPAHGYYAAPAPPRAAPAPPAPPRAARSLRLTRYDRERLAEITGLVSLLGHAVPAALLAKAFLGLPMEAGGLFLGPLLGFPAAFGALLLVAGAVLLALRRPGPVPIGGLVVTLAADVLALVTGLGRYTALHVAGAVLSALSVGFFVSLVRFDAGDQDHSDVVVTVIGFLLAGFVLAMVVPFLLGA